MTTPKHTYTPGPWHIYASDGYRPGIDADNESYSVIIFGEMDSKEGVQGRTIDEAQANARLIAAAPDLYEALSIVQAIAKSDRAAIERLGFDFKSGQKCSEWAEGKIDAALAKARGGE